MNIEDLKVPYLKLQYPWCSRPSGDIMLGRTSYFPLLQDQQGQQLTIAYLGRLNLPL